MLCTDFEKSIWSRGLTFGSLLTITAMLNECLNQISYKRKQVTKATPETVSYLQISHCVIAVRSVLPIELY